jgi:hypothetical protein
MRLLLAGVFAVLLVGCDQGGRYQLVANPTGGWMRLDTKTGELAACGPEAFVNPPKFGCLSFPDTLPAKTKPFGT